MYKKSEGLGPIAGEVLENLLRGSANQPTVQKKPVKQYDLAVDNAGMSQDPGSNANSKMAQFNERVKEILLQGL